MNTTTQPAGAGPLDATVGRHPLIVRDCSSDDGNACFSKGHHDAAGFKAAALAWNGDDMSKWDGPRHEWWRAIPDHTGEYASVFHEATPASRGAFPVTVMDCY